MDAVDKDDLPWLAMRPMCHEHLLCLSRSFVLDNQSNVGSQGEAWRYNSTFDRAQQRANAAWLL